MPIDYIEMITDTDLGIFQVSKREPIQYMNRLFYPSDAKTEVGFPKSWYLKKKENEDGFYQKIDLIKGKHFIKNSIWKYYHGNNHCPFNLFELCAALEMLSHEYGVDTFKFGVDHVEIGVYFQVHFELISKLRMVYKGSCFDAMKPKRSRTIYGWHLELNQFEIKLYDVCAKQRLAGEAQTAPPGSYRYEIKFYDRQYLKSNGVCKVEELLSSKALIYQRWFEITDTICMRLFPELPHTLEPGVIKNLLFFHTDVYPEYESILRRKGGNETTIYRLRSDVKKYSHLLTSGFDLNKRLKEELNSNLL